LRIGSMSRKKKGIFIRPQKLGFSYSKYAFANVHEYQRREIEPVLSRLFEKNMAEYYYKECRIEKKNIK
jgi:hypothetical protein